MFGFYLTDLQSNFWFTKNNYMFETQKKNSKNGLVFTFFFFVKLRLDLYICRNVTLWSLVNLLDFECHTLEGNQVYFYFGTVSKLHKHQNHSVEISRFFCQFIFYVKSILENLDVLKLQFFNFRGSEKDQFDQFQPSEP